MASIGSLIGLLGLDSARFEAGLKQANTALIRFRRVATRTFRNVSRSFDRMAKRVFQYGAALITVAGPAIMGAFIRESFDLIDAHAKLSDTLNISMKSLAGFELAGKRTGATVEQVKKSLEKLAINTEDAARGIGTAKDAFDTLGINAKAFIKLAIDEQMLVMADSLNKVDNATLKLGLTYAIFGRQGTNMIKMLNLGSDALRIFFDRAEKLNIAIDRFDAAKIEAANDAMLEVHEAMKGVSNTVAIKLAPLITDLADTFVNAAMEGKGFTDSITKGFNKVIGVVGLVADAFRVMNLGLLTGKVLVLAIADAYVNLGTVGSRTANAIKNVVKLIQGEDIVEFKDTPIGVFVQSFNDALDDATDKLVTLGNAPMPSEQLKKWVEKVEDAGDSLEGHIVTIQKFVETSFFVKLFREIDALNLQFDDVFLKWDEGLESMKNTFLNNLKKMVRALVASRLSDIFFGGLQSGGLKGIVKDLFGAAHGFEGIVGGRGGTDANVLAMRVTRGETVSVTPAGQTPKGGGGVLIQNTFNVGPGVSLAQVGLAVDAGNKQTIADIRELVRRRRL